MATVLFPLASFNNDACIIYMEYDDIDMRVSGVVCENNTTYPVYAALIKASNGAVYDNIFQPGNSRIDISTQGPTRIDIEDLFGNHWGNLHTAFRFPA